MLQFSHAMGKIFQYRVEHPADICDYCNLKTAKNVENLNVKLLLTYQRTNAISDSIRCCFIAVKHDNLPVTDITHVDIWNDFFRNIFNCKVFRICVDYQDYLPPTSKIITEELLQLSKLFNTSDHMFFYTNINSGQLQFLSKLRRFNPYTNIWWLVENLQPCIVSMFQHSHSLGPDNETVSTVKRDTNYINGPFVYCITCLAPSLMDHFTEILNRRRGRLSILDFLKLANLRGVEFIIHTNAVDIDLQKVYIGFG